MNAFIAKIWRWWFVLLVVLVVAGAYIWVSAYALPEMVAKSFDSAGNMRETMTRQSYRSLMLAVATLLPLAIAGLMTVLVHLEPDPARVPRREYWLRPENRARMYAFLAKWAIVFAMGLAIFMAALHALIVHAHTLQLPQLRGGEELGYVFSGFTITMIVVVFLYLFTGSTQNSSIGERLQAKKPQNARR
jgi:uncharacterized membrane protein